MPYIIPTVQLQNACSSSSSLSLWLHVRTPHAITELTEPVWFGEIGRSRNNPGACCGLGQHMQRLLNDDGCDIYAQT